jgi:16S rRNA (guanine527-N7)-methyltransferase
MTQEADLLALSRRLGVPLGAAQVASLWVFSGLLIDRAVALGLIAEGDSERVLQRHVVDSLRAAAAVGPEDRTGYDLGSGAGLPGIVVAIAAPELVVRLVEPRRKAIAFLELAVAELGLRNAQVVPGRAEELTAPVDLCFARALAPIDGAWQVAAPLLETGGRLVYFAGRRARVPDRLPLAASVRIARDMSLESSGPLVIITRE